MSDPLTFIVASLVLVAEIGLFVETKQAIIMLWSILDCGTFFGKILIE